MIELTKEYPITKDFKASDILTLMQDVGIAHVDLLGVGDALCVPNNLGWFVARTSITFYNEIEDGILSIKTFPHRSNGFEFYREYELTINNKIYARALLLFVLVDLDKLRVVRRKDIYPDGEYLSPIYGISVEKIEPNKNLYLGEYEVNEKDIDKYHHMNNTKYFNIIDMFIKNKRKIVINYVNQAKLNDIIKMYKNNNELTGYHNDQVIFTAYVEE